MKQKLAIFMLASFLVTLVSAPALAANPHFVQGPTFSVVDGAVQASGKIAGLGNQPVTIVLDADVVVTCTNRGGNVPPGQTETVSGQITDVRPEHGNVVFTVTTGEVSDPCPGPMEPTVTVRSATLTVFQRGEVVLQETFTP
jgi:hypothetical protein